MIEDLFAVDALTLGRLNLLSSFFMFYCCVSIAIRFIVKAPKGLEVGKKYHNFFGQHVSLLHSSVACCLALGVYLYEAGVHYNSESNYRHDFVMAVSVTQHSMGYFFYDMIYAEIYGVHDTAMRLHHLMVLVGGSIVSFRTVGGSVGNCES